MSTIKSTTTKQERTTNQPAILLKFLPLWLFIIIAGFIALSILFKSETSGKNYTNLISHSAIQAFPLREQSSSIESTRRFYGIAHALSDAGFIRCDSYLRSKNCPEEVHLSGGKNIFYEIRHKVKKGENKLLSQETKIPYSLLKTMVWNMDLDNGKYIGLVLYSTGNNRQWTGRILNMMTNPQCKKPSFEKWYFVEDRIVFDFIEDTYRIKLKEKSLPVQIMEKKGKMYFGNNAISKKIINQLNSQSTLNQCMEI